MVIRKKQPRAKVMRLKLTKDGRTHHARVQYFPDVEYNGDTYDVMLIKKGDLKTERRTPRQDEE